MSIVKRDLDRQIEGRWNSVSGAVCASCFTDHAIQDFIKENLAECGCSYCGKKTKNELIAAAMDDVLEFISDGLDREYDTPENCLPYNSAEGGWIPERPPYSHDDVFSSLGICSEESGNLSDDLANAFSERKFVPRDSFVQSEVDGLKYSWETFCEQTKHETRFVFFRVKPPRRLENQSWCPDDERPSRPSGNSPPYQILRDLSNIIKDYKLIKTLPEGTNVFRARQHPAEKSFVIAKDLGTPPKENARQSRMSPAGIPMFYGADDENTAFVEIFNKTDPTKDTVTYGTFTLNRSLRFLDLTNLPSVPSIFDRQSYKSRPRLIFLHHFQKDISKPVERNGSEHYEYVPTQIVAEYLRHVYREGRKRVDGIMFKSSHEGAGVCYCIFATAENCTDKSEIESKNKLLLLRSHRIERVDFAKESFT